MLTWVLKQLLRHRVTDTFLDSTIREIQNDEPSPKLHWQKLKNSWKGRKDRFGNRLLYNDSMISFLALVLLGLTYPLWTIISIFSSNVRAFLSRFPASYYLNWGTYVWILVLSIVYHSYVQSFYLFLVLVLMLVSKLIEEVGEMRKGDVQRSTYGRLTAYLFDIWNYIDFMYLVCMSVYFLGWCNSVIFSS